MCMILSIIWLISATSTVIILILKAMIHVVPWNFIGKYNKYISTTHHKPTFSGGTYILLQNLDQIGGQIGVPNK